MAQVALISAGKLCLFLVQPLIPAGVGVESGFSGCLHNAVQSSIRMCLSVACTQHATFPCLTDLASGLSDIDFILFIMCLILDTSKGVLSLPMFWPEVNLETYLRNA